MNCNSPSQPDSESVFYGVMNITTKPSSWSLDKDLGGAPVTQIKSSLSTNIFSLSCRMHYNAHDRINEGPNPSASQFAIHRDVDRALWRAQRENQLTTKSQQEGDWIVSGEQTFHAAP